MKGETRGTKLPHRPARDDLALAVVQQLARDPDLLAMFLDETGLAPSTLRTALSAGPAQDSLMHFLTQRDALIVSIAAELGHRPDSVAAVAQSAGPLPQ